jgi:hypothetical protein
LNALLKELEKQLPTIPSGEVVTIEQSRLGLLGMDRRGLIQWFYERGFKAKFIEETQSIEARKI